ncbi:MAG: hypothetical protein H6737_22640 [Alphaproteobacteria bacterium]|nr:hypothetical protein [Alphaproteobacteria bacterium]
MSLLLLLFACGSSLVPGPVAGPMGKSLCEVGHPKATCSEGRVARESHGPLSFKAKKERWADIAVDYELKGESHAMTIRVYLKNVQPCRVSVEVQDDTGPAPVLLDNALTSRIAGQAICKKLTGG